MKCACANAGANTPATPMRNAPPSACRRLLRIALSLAWGNAPSREPVLFTRADGGKRYVRRCRFARGSGRPRRAPRWASARIGGRQPPESAEKRTWRRVRGRTSHNHRIPGSLGTRARRSWGGPHRRCVRPLGQELLEVVVHDCVQDATIRSPGHVQRRDHGGEAGDVPDPDRAPRCGGRPGMPGAATSGRSSRLQRAPPDSRRRCGPSRPDPSSKEPTARSSAALS